MTSLGPFHVQLTKIDNDSWYAVVIKNQSTFLQERHAENNVKYDDVGALTYVIVIVFLYGFSIILMIGTQVKRGLDSRIAEYMTGMKNVRKIERRNTKFRARVSMMHNKQLTHYLGRRNSDTCGPHRLTMLKKKEMIVNVARSQSERPRRLQPQTGRVKQNFISFCLFHLSAGEL